MCYNFLVYQIKYSKSAAKSLRKLPNDIGAKFRAAFEQIAKSDDGSLDIKKLAGRPGFRVRIGTYRGIYEIANDELLLLVLKIGSRGEVYKK
jgi:mRNA interferase RelE/StbE